MIPYVTVTALFLWMVWWSLLPRIPQNQSFHKFAGDGMHHCCSRSVPNAYNVLSNLPFFAVGLYGMSSSCSSSAGWLVFSAASILVCAGSAYYHWNPNDRTLVWDRLPMTLCTVGVVFEILQHMGYVISLHELALFCVIGVYSVFYWKWYDDLRLYAFVQYMPIIAIWAMLWFGETKLTEEESKQLRFSIVIYSLARVLEYFDYALYTFTPFSGHVWKHIMCAFAMYWIIPTSTTP